MLYSQSVRYNDHLPAKDLSVYNDRIQTVTRVSTNKQLLKLSTYWVIAYCRQVMLARSNPGTLSFICLFLETNESYSYFLLEKQTQSINTALN